MFYLKINKTSTHILKCFERNSVLNIYFGIHKEGQSHMKYLKPFKQNTVFSIYIKVSSTVLSIHSY